MKKILFALILCFPLSFFGQISASKTNAIKTAKVVPTVYAEIIMTSYSSDKQKITIDFGEKNERSLKYSKAAQMEFYTVIDAMNAMSNEGYKLVDSYDIDKEKVTEYHFILSKEMTYPAKPNKPSSARTSSSRKK